MTTHPSVSVAPSPLISPFWNFRGVLRGVTSGPVSVDAGEESGEDPEEVPGGNPA